MSRTTLFFSLGSTPNVLRDTLRGFRQHRIHFDKLVVIGNKGFLTRPDGKKGLPDDTREILDKWNTAPYRILNTGLHDLQTSEENRLYFEKIFQWLEQEKQSGNEIIVSIAGGRKTMSALLLVASYIAGVKNIYHTLVPDIYISGSKKLTTPPAKAINLVLVPQLHFDQLLSPILEDFDEEKEFKGSVFRLIDQLKTEEAFNKLNEQFKEQIRMRKLKEEYRTLYPSFEKMTAITTMIVGDLLKGKLMYQPVIENRVKDFPSFWGKIKRKEKDAGIITNPFQRIKDLAAIRIIFYNSIDMQKAIRILHNAGEFLDAGSAKPMRPKADDRTQDYGYRATHMDVKLIPARRLSLPEYAGLKNINCEIQLTTIFAHSWSKVHHAIVYKKNETAGMKLKFKRAARKLEVVEQTINNLCKEYYKKVKKIKL